MSQIIICGCGIGQTLGTKSEKASMEGFKSKLGSCFGCKAEEGLKYKAPEFVVKQKPWVAHLFRH
jgi:hypothetical protein